LLSPETVKDSIYVDVSNFNKTHDENYDQEQLDVIKQHIFTDVYISINGHALGYWQLPCTIPVKPDYSRENNIRIIPCVREVNPVTTTKQYLFLKPVEQNITLIEEEKYNISSFKFEYRNEVFFPLLETFSQGTDFASIDTINGADIEIFYKPDLKKNVGKITFHDKKKYFDVATPYFYMNGQGEKQFWQIYYMSEGGDMTTYLNFRNTVTGIVNQTLIVLPSTKGVWKKSYFEITEYVSKACGTASRVSVRLGIRGLQNSDSNGAEFYFGNINVVAMEARY
jgi:hypothetical protein